ncbi:MAG: hypothetical protein DHS20C18_31480 [Saprospiraceae bacterium]|nr:MAG: hypothetical protein DHS20C18_31480 [Saprospiraceae bacterium]
MKYSLPLFALVFSLIFTSCGASKELTAEMESAKSSLSQCQDQLNRAQKEIADAKAMLGNNSNQFSQIQAENVAMQTELANLQGQLSAVTQKMQESSDDYGVWFRVQIGAYEGGHIDKSLETTNELSLEERNKLQKVALGRFRNYADAKQLQTQLQAKGLKDAWIVSYKDGVRVPIEEVKK